MQDLYNKVTELFSKRAHIAHDIKHVTRTAEIAKYIAGEEGYDVEEAEVAALLHDIGRTVQDGEKGHGPAGIPLARQLLDDYTDFSHEARRRIVAAVADHSDAVTEGQLTAIVRDADMLDGLGAIGIMRACTSKAHLLDYDPDNFIPPLGQRRDTTVCGQIAFQMEWYDPGFMQTETGKRLAKKRYEFMELFLDELRGETTARDLS